MEVNPGASPFRCIDLTCCKAVALEEARRRQSSPSADAGRPRVLYRLPASTTWRPALLFRPSGSPSDSLPDSSSLRLRAHGVNDCFTSDAPLPATQTVLGWWSRGSQRDHCTADGMLDYWRRPPELVKVEGDSTRTARP